MSWLTQAADALWGWLQPHAVRPPVHLRPDNPFPDPRLADEDGLVAVGGELTVPRLLAAYRAGIFPWYDTGMPVLWWSPDPRAVFDLATFHVPRRLARTIRQGRFEVRFDTAFLDVMRACADRPEGTWITPEMIAAYGDLHRLGHAHSAEAWRDGVLAGGVYGVTVGGLFAGESMFSRVSDASKVAMAALVARLRERGFVLFDAQVINDHTHRLGAVEIPREEYLRRLADAMRREASFA